MCHCIFFGINPHVSKHHAFRLHCATLWTLQNWGDHKEPACGQSMQCPHWIEQKQANVLLHSSKTHNKSDKPQVIKIKAVNEQAEGKQTRLNKFCPFELLHEYINLCKKYLTRDEQFFVFVDRTPVKAYPYRTLLKQLLVASGMEHRSYSTQGTRAGRASELLESGVSVETIRKIGRWKSMAVYTYL